MKRIKLPNEVVIAEARTLLDKGHDVTLRVKGCSMLPFIRGGEDFGVLRKPVASLKKWDIVLAHDRNRRLVLHRIVEITPDTITLMGDGNLGLVEHCNPEDIIARLEYVQRNEQLLDCNSKWARTKAIVWFHLRPVRRYLLAIYRRTNKIQQS